MDIPEGANNMNEGHKEVGKGKMLSGYRVLLAQKYMCF